MNQFEFCDWCGDEMIPETPSRQSICKGICFNCWQEETNGSDGEVAGE